MKRTAEDGLGKWIGAAEVALLESVEEATAERFAGLAAGLLRHCPQKLWDLLREASKGELDEVPALENLLERLAESLVGVGRLAEAGDLLRAARHWEVGLAGSVYRERAKLGEAGGRPVRIALLSSYVLDPLIPFLDVECRRAGLSPAFYVTPFNQYTQEVLDPSSGLHSFSPEIVFVALELEDLFP